MTLSSLEYPIPLPVSPLVTCSFLISPSTTWVPKFLLNSIIFIIICLFLFSYKRSRLILSITDFPDRRLSHFPVYQKDHLFNSNPSWDFGAFRHLQILMKQTRFNSSRQSRHYTVFIILKSHSTAIISHFFSSPLRFAHVFSETGKYVFVDSVVPQWSIVVVVSQEGTDCDPRSAVFQPMSPANLVKYGIVKDHKLNLLPDWGMIAGK